MKRRIFASAALLCCLVVCLIIATDVTGKWTGSILLPDGNQFPISYVFKVDGDKLTGVASSKRGDVDITDGKVTDSVFTFSLVVHDGIVKHTGKYYAKGDSIGLDIDFKGEIRHAALKRSTQ